MLDPSIAADVISPLTDECKRIRGSNAIVALGSLWGRSGVVCSLSLVCLLFANRGARPKGWARIETRNVPRPSRTRVREADIAGAMRRLYDREGLVVEPSSAVPVAVVKEHERELQEPVCRILTGEGLRGGNRGGTLRPSTNSQDSGSRDDNPLAFPDQGT